MPIAFFMALQFLREGKTQSLMIASAMGVGVAIIVFLSALISGLQADLIQKTLGSQAHVSMALPDEVPRALWGGEKGSREENAIVLTRFERAAQRGRGLSGWRQTVEELEGLPMIEAVSPLVSGPGFAVRGSATQSINLLGVLPERHDRVIDVSGRLLRGRMISGGTEGVIGVTLADELGIDVGDKLRVQAAGDRSEQLTVVGVFDLGNGEVNRRWVITPLRAAQTLLGQIGTITQIELRVSDPFTADQVAGLLRARTGLETESWMETNAQLLSALRSQSASSLMIQVFVILSVSIGIASVLVVSVVQKQRQIGILRAMGFSRARVARVFVIQGALLGVLGSGVGLGLGAGMAALFSGGRGDGATSFPIELDAGLMSFAALVAISTGLVAALLPALRAARLDPAEAIRHD